MHIGIVDRYQDLKRYSHIASVFVRYGFGELLDRLRAEHYLPRRRRVFGRKAGEFRHLSTPERLRRAFEELGPTFIKLGQILSTRADLLPPSFIQEFSKLQDSAPPFPFADICDTIESEFRRPVSEVFLLIEERPLAAASLAQVHRARTGTGARVAVKVQRPHIRALLETDIRILHDFANLSERRLPESRYYQPVRLVNEFARTIRRELDFVREGRNIERFRRYFAGDATVYIPKVYWDLSAPKILTTEYIEGVKISDIDGLNAAGLDREAIAVNGADFTLKEVFEHHFFHADPHPGNLFVLEDNVIAPVDYGMTGAISDDLADHILAIFIAVMDKDIDSLVRLLQEGNWVPENLDVDSFKLELQDFLERYHGLSLQEVNMSEVLGEAMNMIRRYRLHMPIDLVLMARALLVTEGVARMLYPEFNIVEHAGPYAKKLVRQRYGPIRYMRELYEVAGEAEAFARRLPGEMGQLLTKVMRGDLSIKFLHTGLENLIMEMEKSSNRLSFAVVIAALIIGSSLIFQSGLGPALLGYPVMGLVGFLFASILGIWLIASIMRSGKL
ncbi:MAG: putative protein kinase UbiB [Syntrophorhabdaceae bacterium PtaU1.Bin034]|nr:MAG: putative protein kinase UbiB [Syntrophorhabdaceae bacterium PtaU1.Bin034]